jgi:hypothetical protein
LSGGIVGCGSNQNLGDVGPRLAVPLEPRVHFSLGVVAFPLWRFLVDEHLEDVRKPQAHARPLAILRRSKKLGCRRRRRSHARQRVAT